MYIVLEGPEGCGKSTQAKLLHERLSGMFPSGNVILTKEPGSTMLESNQKIRKILLETKESLSADAEFLLFQADRANHMDNIILPGIRNRDLIVSDRSYISTIVYRLVHQMDADIEFIKDAFEKSHKSLSMELYKMLPIVSFAQKARPDFLFVGTSSDEWRNGILGSREKDRIEQRGDEYHSCVRYVFEYMNILVSKLPENLKPKKTVILPPTNKAKKNQMSDIIINSLEII